PAGAEQPHHAQPGQGRGVAQEAWLRRGRDAEPGARWRLCVRRHPWAAPRHRAGRDGRRRHRRAEQGSEPILAGHLLHARRQERRVTDLLDGLRRVVIRERVADGDEIRLGETNPNSICKPVWVDYRGSFWALRIESNDHLKLLAGSTDQEKLTGYNRLPD